MLRRVVPAPDEAVVLVVHQGLDVEAGAVIVAVPVVALFVMWRR
jgi:hypothetical protein